MMWKEEVDIRLSASDDIRLVAAPAGLISKKCG
jgi:hypothetical protein